MDLQFIAVKLLFLDCSARPSFSHTGIGLATVVIFQPTWHDWIHLNAHDKHNFGNGCTHTHTHQAVFLLVICGDCTFFMMINVCQYRSMMVPGCRWWTVRNDDASSAHGLPNTQLPSHGQSCAVNDTGIQMVGSEGVHRHNILWPVDTLWIIRIELNKVDPV